MSVIFRDVLLLDPQGLRGPTDVLVEGQRITRIGSLSTVGDTETRVIHGHGHHLLVPGLINAHFHSPANHLKGAFDSLPLELFMLFESPDVEALRPTPREAYLRTMLAALEMVRNGTTAVQDDAFLMPSPDPEIIDAVLSAYEDSGLRATVALDQPELPEALKLPYLGDLRADAHDPAPMPAAGLLEMYEHLITRWHGAADGRLSAAVSISAPQRVGVEYFQALDDLGRRHDLPLFAHMLETKVQRVLATEQPRFAGRSLVRYTADLGLLNERTNVIHAVWVDDADLDLIASAGAVIAHNPVSNLRLGSGVMPFRRIADRGIPIALGVDEAICDDSVNMWSVLKTAGLIHNVSGLDSDLWPQPSELLDCLWTGGAAAIRRTGQIGAIAPGYLADLTLIDLHTLPFTPLNDVARQLVYCHDGRSVVLTMVDGRIVVDHGKVLTVNENDLLAEAREVFARQLPVREAAYEQARAALPDYQRMVRRAHAVDVGMNRWVGA